MSLSYGWPVRVYYEDTDHGGIVYHANYLKFMERCRTEMLRAKGLELDRLSNEFKLIFAVRRVEIDFLSPAKFNDKLLVTAKIVKSSKVRLNFQQSVYRCEPDFTPAAFFYDDKLENNNTLLCRAEISIVLLSASQLKPKRIPQPLFEELFSGQ